MARAQQESGRFLRTNPVSELVLLPHCQAGNTHVLRDVTDDKIYESPIAEQRNQQCNPDQNRSVERTSLDDRRPTTIPVDKNALMDEWDMELRTCPTISANSHRRLQSRSTPIPNPTLETSHSPKSHAKESSSPLDVQIVIPMRTGTEQIMPNV